MERKRKSEDCEAERWRKLGVLMTYEALLPALQGLLPHS